MSSLFLPRDSVSKRNDDGSLATVYVADVDVDSGEILVVPNPITTSIMARQVMFHKTHLLDVIEENTADISPACELLRLRLQILTERAKAHIQRQSSYASAHEAYVSALSSSYAYGLNILDQRDFDDESKPHAWGVECMTDIIKPINYHVVFAPAIATTATTTTTTASTSETSSAASVAASPSRGTKRAASDAPSASVYSLPKRARLASDLSTSNDGNLPHRTTTYAAYYSDPSTKAKKRSRSDSDEEDRAADADGNDRAAYADEDVRAPKRARELSATVLTPLPLDDDDFSDADAEGEEDEDYTPAITPEVALAHDAARPSFVAPWTNRESNPVAGCGPRATQGLKTLCLPIACHTALPRQADVDEPLSDTEDLAADDPASDDDDSGSIYEPPSRSPTPMPSRSSRRLRSRNAKPYDRPSTTTKPRPSTKKFKSRASTSRSTSSRASSSSSSSTPKRKFKPIDAAAAIIGSNCKFPAAVRRLITPVDAPNHINLGLDNARPGAKKPACSICGHATTGTGNLSRHVLTHIRWLSDGTGDMERGGLWRCDHEDCELGYARKDSLKRHLETQRDHTGSLEAQCQPEMLVGYGEHWQIVKFDVRADD
ncbi:hypothetical protein EV121DRAFT_214509 [Schizophyllum commune]